MNVYTVIVSEINGNYKTNQIIGPYPSKEIIFDTTAEKNGITDEKQTNFNQTDRRIPIQNNTIEQIRNKLRPVVQGPKNNKTDTNENKIWTKTKDNLIVTGRRNGGTKKKYKKKKQRKNKSKHKSKM